METAGITIYARHEHGGHPVHILDGDTPAFEVEWDANKTERFGSRRQLVRALYGRPARDPGMSFARYFKLGPHSTDDVQAGPTIFDLFESTPKLPLDPIVLPTTIVSPGSAVPTPRPRKVQRVIVPEPGTTLDLFGTPDLTATPTLLASIPCRWSDAHLEVVPASYFPDSTDLKADLSPLGVDLVNRSHEVRKLLFAGFGIRISRGGYDPEDVLQEVYKGLLARNRGTCQFDPNKSSFGHYVHMVCSCVLANYHRKEARRGTHEQVGMYSPHAGDDEPSGQVDASLVAADHCGETPEDAGEVKAINSLRLNIIRSGAPKVEVRIAIESVPLVYQGMTRREIADRLEVEPTKVGKALALIRRVAAGWGQEQGLLPA
jgi:DNA-directed RNA polymerase specialized sigma24 family protein